jgi:outer membrane biosynthesis protein TonB
MKSFFWISIFLTVSRLSFAQGGEEYFHQGSGSFIRKDIDQALASVNKGLKLEPSSKKLQELKKLLEQQKKDQQQKDQQDKDQQQKQDQQKKEQEKKEQEKKDQEKKEEEKKKEEEEKKKDQEKKPEDEKDKQEQKPEDKPEEKKETPPDVSEKLKQMQMDEQKARMILEAMKNQEIQYLQQNKRKATKPKDKNKPDW